MSRAVTGAGYLLFPSDCVCCGALDAVLCSSCAAALRRNSSAPFEASDDAELLLSLTGEPIVTVYAAARYQAEVSAALLAFKNHGALGLAGPLARGLGAALRHALAEQAHGGRVLLVPVPTSASGFAKRGYDPLQVLLRHRTCQAALGDLSRRVRVRPLLRTARRPWSRPNQKSLGKAGRAANVAGSLKVRSRLLRRVRGGARAPCTVLLVDDVLTTGATLREAQRTLAIAGVPVQHAVVLAAVPQPQRGRED